MKKQKVINKYTMLDKEIDFTEAHLNGMSPIDEDYKTVVENLERLYKVRNVKHERRISNDTIAIIAGNLLGIGLILSYEKLNVVSTKALGFVMKGRV